MRPKPDEYGEYYAGYVDLVPEEHALPVLRDQLAECEACFASIADDRWSYRYAPGKWSIKQLVGHLIDTEWIFTGRALWFARGTAAPLPGMDQDEFVDGANFDDQEPPGLRAQFRSLRQSTLDLFDSFDEATLLRRGIASECEFTVRAFAFLLAGHTRHHLGVLRGKYLEG